MSYRMTCDGYPLLDLRDEEYIIFSPSINIEVNKVGEGSFTIYSDHPYYDKLKKLKSVFEVSDDNGVIFRGRMTSDTMDFNNGKDVDLEGAMAYFNDSIIRPYVFPDDFLSNAEYTAAAASGNVIEYFLKWLIDTHNSQVQDFQRFKLGVVTVTDPNNYLSRSDEGYTSTWDVLRSKLFESALGGFLCIRYEADGNYIDYLSEFTETNEQPIAYGENLLDLSSEVDATATYSAIIPIGAEAETAAEGEESVKKKITLAELGDGEITSDIVKSGDTLYSKKAVDTYGWIYAPVSETTWEDVTEAANLQAKAVDFLTNTGVMLSNTVELSAVDLHFTDAEVQSFRLYKNVEVHSKPHEHEATYQLTKLNIDLINPQNTKITVGNTRLTLTDINNRQSTSSAQSIKLVQQSIEDNAEEVKKALSEQEAGILAKCEETYTSKIEQLAKSITLEVSGSLGSKANITLSVNGETSTDSLDLSEVRKAFANDASSVTITGGVVTFNAGTLVINSSNFQVTAEGVVTATSGTIGAITLSTTGIYSHNSSYSRSYAGWYRPLSIATDTECFFAGASDATGTNAKFMVTYGGALKATEAEISGILTTTDSPYMAKLTSGGLGLYYNDVLCGTFNTKYWSGASTPGISLRIEEGGNYIMFSHPNSDHATGFEVDYYLNYGWSSNYDEMHIFQTSARFLDDVYLDGYTRIRSLRLFGANGEYLVGIDASGNLSISKL